MRLPDDMTEIPLIGSRSRNEHEAAALERGRELLHLHEGSIRAALDGLEQDLRSNPSNGVQRAHARLLVSHVEQCWATAVLA